MQFIKLVKVGTLALGLTGYVENVSARFVQADPIGLAGGINSYAYTGNNPVNFIDPSGLLSLNLYPRSQNIYAAENGDNPVGVYSVGGHGTPSNIEDQNGIPLSPNQLAEIIQNDPAYKTGTVIQLHSCETGKGKNSFAQRLSNIMNIPVVAPNDLYASHFTYNPDGTNIKFTGSTIGPDPSQNTGNWVTFIPTNPSSQK